jgi:signal transduction histidine kinase
MQKMFQSATLKLTAWYLAILMTISITFSVVIFQLNSRELRERLESLQHSLVDTMPGYQTDTTFNFGYGPGTAYFIESSRAASQMALTLIYINVFVLVGGGLGSYFLARRTLKPIEDAHESQSRFTSDASHELRTPLSAMKAELEVTLRDQNLSLEEAKEVLGSNLEEVDKLIQLSQMLLHLSRLDHDKLEYTSIDLVAVFDEIMKRYSTQKDRFEVNARKKAVTRANDAAVSELMGILIDNALKYSPDNTKLFIRIFEQRGYVGFEIKNEGKKIPQEKLERLFDRFYRADTSRTNSSKNGYGLGLSIAKKIADVHNGYLTVASTKEFTTFTFYLPIVRRHQTKAQSDPLR